MKKSIGLLITLIFLFGPNSVANAHGGGLDSQGGHNCRVGSCAGTYHCHQPRGPVCQEAMRVPPNIKPTPKPSKSKKTEKNSNKNKSKNKQI